jgi:hypothetical protein
LTLLTRHRTTSTRQDELGALAAVLDPLRDRLDGHARPRALDAGFERLPELRGAEEVAAGAVRVAHDHVDERRLRVELEGLVEEV